MQLGDKTARTGTSTGVRGLDDVLAGGLAPGHVYLLEGNPGTGKTTIGLSFLLAGAAAGERGLYITLSETEAELRSSAASHGWTIGEGVEIFELTPPESLLDPNQQQSLLYSSDLELGETTRLIFQTVERANPSRIVLDSLSEIRLLAQGSLRYRRQILAMKHYFSRRDVTVLMLDDLTSDPDDKTVHSVVHGVVKLQEVAHELITSDVAPLDALLGGGILRGSSTLVLGPAGTGKTTFAIQFVAAAIRRGEKAALFVFDEEVDTLMRRAAAIGFDLPSMRAAGMLHVAQIDAAELAPGEFAHRVRETVTRDNAKTVVIDSLNGYQSAMPQENELVLHIHELLQYLNRQGASTFLTVAQHGLFGDMRAPVDITYLADTVVLLRYFEAAGEVRRAVSVIKKRFGEHEPTIREYRIGIDGLAVGEPLSQFQGVLRGVPVFVGDRNHMLTTGED